jgi:lipopolysaccharide/colanic/teichoic acid biosynthesis glycosyltransferase
MAIETSPPFEIVDSSKKTRQKFEHGLYYVKHWSPGLDQLFISATIKAIVLRRSAQ